MMKEQSCLECFIYLFRSHSNGIQPKSDGLQPNSNGLQPPHAENIRFLDRTELFAGSLQGCSDT